MQSLKSSLARILRCDVKLLGLFFLLSLVEIHAVFGAEPAAADVLIVIGEDPPLLERFAADELKTMLEGLFVVSVRISNHIDRPTIPAILIGRPTTNREISRLASQDWPKLTDQGIHLRRLKNDRAQVIIGGGSDVATLWAVYEFGERLGVRYLHNRDVYPAQRPWPGLPDLDHVSEPNLRIRCWRLINDLPLGPVSWSLDENRRFLRQLAKMKFNRVRLQFWPAQPFVSYSLRGMSKPKGQIYFGQHFPIDNDTIGREKFENTSEFTNPEFVDATTADQLHEKAVHLAREIIAEASRLGMETAIGFEPTEWPKEFKSVLPGTEDVIQVGELTIGPGANQSFDDAVLREATATVIKAYRDQFPNVDYLIFTMPEHGRWVGHAAEAYRRLIDAHQLQEIVPFGDLCEMARKRTNFPGGGARVERQLKNDLSSLWLFDSLLREHQLLKRPGGGSDIKLIYDGVVSELFPVVAKVVPPGGQVVSFIDYTASRQLQRRELLQNIPPKDVPAGLIFTLADDNVGVLPQLATGSLHQLMALLRQYEWAGFYTRYWTVGDLDPTIHFLARGSWNADLTPVDAYADQVAMVCGPGAVEPAIAAFDLIEKITLGLDQHGLGFGFPVPGMMTKHFDAGRFSTEINRDRESYRTALALMEKSHRLSRRDGQEYTGYFLHRLKFAVRYLDAAEAFAATSEALSQNRRDLALEQVNVAYTAIRDALQAYADVARDHGDLGAIAAMNKYCYRPIRDKRLELQAASSK